MFLIMFASIPSPLSVIIKDFKASFEKLKFISHEVALASYEFFINSNRAILSFFIKSSPK